jgi:hypothetical protein
MLKIKNFEFYDDIRTLPVLRYKEFKKLVLKKGGIGSDINDVIQNNSNALSLIASNRIKEATDALQNMYFSLNFIFQGEEIKSYVLASMLYSVDGEPIGSIDDNSIEKYVNLIEASGITIREMEELIAEISKKYSED